MSSALVGQAIEILVPENRVLKRILNTAPDELHRILARSFANIPNAKILFRYSDKLVRLLIRKVKYYDHPEVKALFVSYLAEEILEFASEHRIWSGKPPILVPMPMSKSERRSKGWNHSAEIVRAIEHSNPRLFQYEYDLLEKTRETKKQSSLGRTERLRNVRNSMAVDGRRPDLKGRVVVILDDVYTTGATFAEARRALKSAGTRRVYGIFLAGP